MKFFRTKQKVNKVLNVALEKPFQFVFGFDLSNEGLEKSEFAIYYQFPDFILKYKKADEIAQKVAKCLIDEILKVKLITKIN